jgi:hypothetical protein
MHMPTRRVGELSRFTRAPQVMGYSGMGAREDSSGTRTPRGGITKTGNAHLRRIAIETAWAYRHRPAVGGALRKRQATLSEEVKAIGWKAQLRLHAYVLEHEIHHKAQWLSTCGKWVLCRRSLHSFFLAVSGRTSKSERVSAAFKSEPTRRREVPRVSGKRLATATLSGCPA